MLKLAQGPGPDLAPRRPAAKGRRNARQTHYFAFLSYSHQDSELADWLVRQLERFKVPRSLAGQIGAHGVIPSRLRPIFRDANELGAAGDLGEEITSALASSQFLIVLCSPAAATSRWTNLEVDTFKRHHPEGTFAVIARGEPFASEMPGRESEECFPPALRQKYDRRGRPTEKRAEPLAADLRGDAEARRRGFFQLVAGMLGIGLDDLLQRDQTRRQRRLAYLAAASLAGMTITSTLAILAIQARDEARDQRRQAEGLVGFMLGDLRDKLEPIGRLDALDAVGSRALAYFERQDKSELSDEALAQRARALTLMGEIANTRGDLNGAMKHYDEALKSTEEALRRYPDDAQRLFDHAQNVFWVGYIDYLRGRPAAAAARFAEYKAMADRMVSLSPGKKEYRLEQVYANTNLGTVQLDVRQYRQAISTYQASLAAAEDLVTAEPRNVDYQKQVITSLAWLADAHEYSGAIDDALAERERQLRLLDTLEQLNPRDAEIRRDAMTTHRAIGRLQAARGDSRRGLQELRASVAIADELFRIEPDNTEWMQAGAAARFDLAELQLALAQPGEAGETIRAACATVDRLVARDSTVSDWKSRLRANCLTLRARLALAEKNPEQSADLARQAVAAADTSPKPLDRQMLRFTALAVGGQAISSSGDRDRAQRVWRGALRGLPKSIEYRPDELRRIAQVHRSLGNQAEWRKLSSSLARVGFRYPQAGGGM